MVVTDAEVAAIHNELNNTSEKSDLGINLNNNGNNAFVNPAFHVETGNVTLPENVTRPDAETITRAPVTVTSDEFQEDTKHKYGWNCVSNERIQILNRPFVFLICLSLGGIAQGLIVSGISLSVLTSIEKQFGLKSSEVAVFTTVYDTAYGICSLYIGYFGTAHKPRYLGWGLLIMVLGAVLCSVPYFIISPYEAGEERYDDFCNPGNDTHIATNVAQCKGKKAWYYQLIFIIGYTIMGIGGTPLYTLGPAHIDEVTERGQSSMYLGVFYAASAIGPALGFILAMPVLRIWVDIEHQPISLNPSSYNWIGAWWLGFLIGAFLLLIPIIPTLGFPRIFPDTDDLRGKKKEFQDNVPEDKSLEQGWSAIKALLRNPPFIFISLGIAAESLALGGFSTFVPKFVETQYHLAASSSALYTGVVGIPSAAGGILLGGYFVKKFKWNCKQILRAASILSLTGTIFTGFILVGCHSRDIKIPITTSELNDTCNRDCNCNVRYKPICVIETEQTFYSPCHAGCVEEQRIGSMFHNCSCFAGNVTEAKDGRCTPDCPLFPVFIVGIFFLVVFTFINNVPLINATFRMVNQGQGAFAMGFQQIFVRFLGFIPSPIIYGSLIDRSCDLWQSAKCNDETTNCLEYNHKYFRYYMFALALGIKLIAFTFLFIGYKLYKLPLPKDHSPSTSGTTGITTGIDNLGHSVTLSSVNNSQ